MSHIRDACVAAQTAGRLHLTSDVASNGATIATVAAVRGHPHCHSSLPVFGISEHVSAESCPVRGDRGGLPPTGPGVVHANGVRSPAQGRQTPSVASAPRHRCERRDLDVRLRLRLPRIRPAAQVRVWHHPRDHRQHADGAVASGDSAGACGGVSETRVPQSACQREGSHRARD